MSGAEDWVYFLYHRKDDSVKVGHSVRPFQRQREIQNRSGRKNLTPLGYVLGGERLEKEIHAKLWEHRITGEWFHYKPSSSIINFYLTSYGDHDLTNLMTVETFATKRKLKPERQLEYWEPRFQVNSLYTIARLESKQRGLAFREVGGVPIFQYEALLLAEYAIKAGRGWSDYGKVGEQQWRTGYWTESQRRAVVRYEMLERRMAKEWASQIESSQSNIPTTRASRLRGESSPIPFDSDGTSGTQIVVGF